MRRCPSIPPPAVMLAVLLVTGLAAPARGQNQRPAVGLQDALALFHRNSPTLAAARSRLRRELAEVSQSRALPNPTASFSNEDLGDDSERYLNLRQEVGFLWGRGALERRAQAQDMGARTRFRADSAALALEAKRSYLEAWHAAERLAALQRVDGLVQALVEAASARYQEGDLAGYDVRRLQVERSTAARKLALGARELRAAEERLGSLVGDGEGKLGARELPGDPPGMDALDAGARALQQRPEVVEAGAAVGSWEASTALARSRLVQGASVIGGLKSQSDGREGLFLGIELPIPLLDRRGAAVEAALSGVEEAEQEAESVRRWVRREASLAGAHLAAVHALRARLGDAGVGDSEELLRIARVAYDEGEIGIVELIDAADTYLEAHLMRIGIQVEGWVAYFELERAVGGFGDGLSVEGGDER